MSRVECRDAIIAAMPGTAPEVVAKAKCSRRSFVKWVGILRREKIVRIEGWRRTPHSGPHLPIYGLGSAKDATCRLLPISSKERYRRQKAKITDEQRDKLKQKWSARHFSEKAVRKGNAFQLQSLFFAKPKPNEDATAKD